MLNKLQEKFSRWFKQLGVCGWLRFRIHRLAYVVFPSIGSRKAEWDFCLMYLPKVKRGEIRRVLDIGSWLSLFPYELEHRGYYVTMTDQQDYQEELPGNMLFVKEDIRRLPYLLFRNWFDYITAISVVEHIGKGEYGDQKFLYGDKIAIGIFHGLLKQGGVLLLTVPTIKCDYVDGYTVIQAKQLFDKNKWLIGGAMIERGQIMIMAVKQ